MSVKGFLDKYFKPDCNKVSPDTILEPMVGTVARKHLEYKTVEVKPKVDTVHIFTDGACSDNGKRSAKGGYGVHVYGRPELDVSSPLLPNEPQTNNRAELKAIQSALDLVDRFSSEWTRDIFIWSDSEYSIHCLTKWAKGWRNNSWKKRDGGFIQNLDLIKPLYERLLRLPQVSLHHVRGHQDAKRNEFPYDGNHRADELATRSLRT